MAEHRDPEDTAYGNTPDPFERGETLKDDETPLGNYEPEYVNKEHEVTRVEDGHTEHFERAYKTRLAEEEAKYRHRYSAAQAAVRNKQGLQRHDFKPHSLRVAEIEAVQSDSQTRIHTPLSPEDQKKVKKEVAEYNDLRSKYLEIGKLPHLDLLRFRDLHTKYVRDEDEPLSKNTPELVYKPNKAGDTTHQAEQKRIQKELEREFPVNNPEVYPRHNIIRGEVAHGAGQAGTDFVLEQKGSGERETPESVIGKYGQEDLSKRKKAPWETNLEAAKQAKVGTYSLEHGFQEEPTRFGWESTYRFNKEQAKRKIKGLKTGETSLGWGERGSGGYNMGVPIEKAKFSIGPNKEWHIKTSEWEQVKQGGLGEPDKTPGQDKFIVRLKENPREIGPNMSPTGKVYTSGQDLAETLRQAGLSDKLSVGQLVERDELGIKLPTHPPKGRKKNKGTTPLGYDVSLVTKQGEHLNPDELEKLKQALHTNHGLVGDVKVVKGAQWKNKRAVVPAGFHKLPKGIKQEQIMPGTEERTIFKNRFGAKFGERQFNGELGEGETDRLGMQVGPWALQHHFDESTDAIGWGTSWRPGNKEVSAVALAYPRAKRNRKIFEAHKADEAGDTEAYNNLIAEEHPELETEGEKSEQKEKYRQHGKELAAAGFASAYYSTKKGLPVKIGAKVYHGAEKLPVVGKKISNAGFESNLEEFFRNVDLAKQPLSAKMERARYRIANPLGDPNDPTMAGISWDEKRLHLPAWRYRRFPIHPANREGRRFERSVSQLAGRVKAREDINEFLSSGKKNIYRKWEARSAVVDPAHRMSNRLVDQITRALQDVSGAKAKQDVLMGVRNIKMDESKEAKIYHDYLNKAETDLTDLKAKIEANPEKYSHESLRSLWQKRYPHRIKHIPKGIKIGGEIGLGATALVGGSLLAVDRYQVYKQNKGEHIEHPILNAVVPERIIRPTVSIKKTHEYTIPTNAATDALDFQGEKIPVGWKLQTGKKQVAQLKNFRDISGEGYKKSLPLFGGIGSAPAPIKGSIKNAVLPESAKAPIGETKNMYVAGKKLPVNFAVGRKERWSDRNHRLRASNNPYKLSQDDREHLLQLAESSPQAKEQIESFYFGDKKLSEMIHDPDETARIKKKNVGWLEGGKSHRLLPIEEIKAKAGVGTQKSMTFEEAKEVRNQYTKARKQKNRTDRARKKYL